MAILLLIFLSPTVSQPISYFRLHKRPALPLFLTGGKKRKKKKLPLFNSLPPSSLSHTLPPPLSSPACHFGEFSLFTFPVSSLTSFLSRPLSLSLFFTICWCLLLTLSSSLCPTLSLFSPSSLFFLLSPSLPSLTPTLCLQLECHLMRPGLRAVEYRRCAAVHPGEDVREKDRPSSH